MRLDRISRRPPPPSPPVKYFFATCRNLEHLPKVPYRHNYRPSLGGPQFMLWYCSVIARNLAMASRST